MGLEDAYNLLEEKWIPVLYSNGRTGRVGIYQVLMDAGKIRQIAASNPMDRVALLRFLLAVLMWCKENAKSALAELGENSIGITESWLAKLKEHKASFNLLGDGNRFYQEELLNGNESRPIADLLVEFPGADSVNHMRHVVHDGSYGLCPACCALGILRLSVWAPANRFYPASVNPGSAAYAFIERMNLFQTLCANLPETNPQVDQAPWLGNEPPNSPDAVARLAWRPRKLWLNMAKIGGLCANCGQSGTLIKSLCIEKGWSTPVTSGQQFGKNVLSEFQKLSDDYKAKTTDKRKLADKVVKVAPVILKCRMSVLLQADSYAEQVHEDKSAEAKIARIVDQLFETGNQEIIKKLIRKPTKEEMFVLDREDTQAKKFWLEDPHLLKQNEPIGLPDLNADVAMHASRFWRDALMLRGAKAVAVGIVGDGQYIYHDAPSALLPDTSDDINRRANLTSDCSVELRDLLRQLKQNPKGTHLEIDSVVKLLTPNAEAQIRGQLKQLSASFCGSATDEKTFLREIYSPMVERVIASITPGSPLRRKAMQNQAQALLNEKINELAEKSNKSAIDSTVSGSAVVNPNSDRQKGGTK